MKEIESEKDAIFGQSSSPDDALSNSHDITQLAKAYNDQLSDLRLSKPLKTEIKPFEERVSIIRLKGKQKLLQRNKEVLGVDGH